MKNNLLLGLVLLCLLPFSTAIIVIPKTSTGISNWNDLLNTGTIPAGLADGVDNTGGTPDWDSVTNKPLFCYANGTGCTDTNNYLTSVTASNESAQHLFNFSVPGKAPIYLAIEDVDSWAGNISDYYTAAQIDELIPSLLTYYFWDIPSSINSTFTIMNTSQNPMHTIHTKISLVDGQPIVYRLNENTNLTGFGGGDLHLHTTVTKLNGTQTLRIRGVIAKYLSNGTVVDIATTGQSNILMINTPTNLSLFASIPQQSLNINDRLLWRLEAIVSGGGTAPSINISVGGTTYNGIDIPVQINDVYLTNYYTKAEGDSRYLLISNWNSTNTSYATKEELNNGSYFNPDLSGYATTSYVDEQNTSQTNYIDSQDNSYNTSNNNYILANNGSVNNYITQNNGSIVNWVTNIFATISSLTNYVQWSVLWTQVYNETEVNAINTSVNNYIAQNNGSVNNYILANNGSVNNYIVSAMLGRVYQGGNTTTTKYLIFGLNNGTNLTVSWDDQTGSGGAPQWIINSTNSTIYNVSTGATTERIISELNYTLQSNSKYRVQCELWYRSINATTGITVNLSFSVGVTSHTLRATAPASATTVENLNETATTGYAGFNSTGSAGANLNGPLNIRGYVTTGANAPNLQYRFKSELNGVANWVIVSADSTCQYTKVA